MNVAKHTNSNTTKVRKKHAFPAVLPQFGFVRLCQIIGNAKAVPPIPALIPIGKSSWWAGISSGRFPKGIKLGPRTTVWRIDEVQALINGTTGVVLA